MLYVQTLDKLITYVRTQSLSLEEEKLIPTKFMLNYLQDRLPEFENHSHTSLAFLLSNARIIDLHSRES